MQEELRLTYVTLFVTSLMITVLLVILFAVFINKKNDLIRQKQHEEVLFNQQLYKSELKALRGQMNPHFIHNTINAIQYYVSENRVKESEKYLQTFSSLIRMYFDYSRRSVVSVKEEIQLLKAYLDIEKIRFEEKLNFHIHTDPDLDLNKEKIPSMLLQPIVENAVRHGIFHKLEPGHINISFLRDQNGGLGVEVIDDGVGLNSHINNNKQKIDPKKSHSGEVLRERLELLSKSKEWILTYSIHDRSDISDQQGTIVKLDLKYNNHE